MTTALSIAALDGYFTALIIGPRAIMPSQWLPNVLPESGLKDMASAQVVLNRLMSAYNEIAQSLEPIPPSYHPPQLPKDVDSAETLKKAKEWASGFWKAMQIDLKDWEPILRDDSARPMLGPILGFIDKDGKPLLTIDNREDSWQEAIELIPGSIPAIKAYWRLHEKERMIVKSQHSGRNDPCPCGSGKKYKRCCGSN